MDRNKIYLVQTDTTVGFSSANDKRLSKIKQRPLSQKMLQTVNSFETLNKNTRVPKIHRRRVRKSKKTTFIYLNLNSFRVIDKNDKFYDFINKFHALYSTSANLTGNNYDEKFAKKNSDILVILKDGYTQNIASCIYKINKIKIKKVR